MKVKWNLFSKFRQELFGLAILSIIIFHYFEGLHGSNISNLTKIISHGYTALFGTMGVEMFVLLSGMGLTFSLYNNSNIVAFYIRRAIRILPTYVIISFPFWLVTDVFVSKNFSRFIADFTFVSFFTKGVITYWYVLFALFTYMVFPIVFKILNTGENERKIRFVGMFLGILVIIFLISKFNHPLYARIGIALDRIPTFLIGSYIGEKVYHDSPISKLEWAVVNFAGLVWVANFFVFVFTGRYSLSLFMQMISVTPVMLLLAKTFKLVGQQSFVSKLFAFLGGISLEVYLVHITLRHGFSFVGLSLDNLVTYILMICLSIFVAFLLQQVVSKSITMI